MESLNGGYIRQRHKSYGKVLMAGLLAEDTNSRGATIMANVPGKAQTPVAGRNLVTIIASVSAEGSNSRGKAIASDYNSECISGRLKLSWQGDS